MEYIITIIAVSAIVWYLFFRPECRPERSRKGYVGRELDIQADGTPKRIILKKSIFD